MNATIGCPHCHNGLIVPASTSGQVVTCPHCGGQLTVPAVGTALPPPTPTLPAEPPARASRFARHRDDEQWQEDPAPQRSLTCGGCVLGGLVVLLGLGIAGFFASPSFRQGGRKGEATASHKETPTPARPSAALVQVRTVPFRTAMGLDTLKVCVDWKNTGNRPVRAVEATIRGYDDKGNSWVIVASYTIFAAWQDTRGVAPGEIHTADESKEGFILPPKPEVLGRTMPTRVEVEITNVFEEGIK